MLKSLVLAFSLFSMTAYGATLKLNTKESKIEWLGKKVVSGQHNGTINVKNGWIKFDGEMPKTAEIVVDMNTIVNLDLKDAKWNKKLVGHLNSEDFFDIKKHPTATYKIKSFTKKGGMYTLNGHMTIRGVTKPFNTQAKLMKSKNSATLNAKVMLDRTDYNVKYGSGKFFKGLGDKMIADEIELNVKLVAGKANDKA